MIFFCGEQREFTARADVPIVSLFSRRAARGGETGRKEARAKGKERECTLCGNTRRLVYLYMCIYVYIYQRDERARRGYATCADVEAADT